MTPAVHCLTATESRISETRCDGMCRCCGRALCARRTWRLRRTSNERDSARCQLAGSWTGSGCAGARFPRATRSPLPRRTTFDRSEPRGGGTPLHAMPSALTIVEFEGKFEWKLAEYENEQTFSHVVEIAKSGRARCRKCAPDPPQRPPSSKVSKSRRA